MWKCHENNISRFFTFFLLLSLLVQYIIAPEMLRISFTAIAWWKQIEICLFIGLDFWKGKLPIFMMYEAFCIGISFGKLHTGLGSNTILHAPYSF